MNLTAEQLMIGRRLRDLSASWIGGIRHSLQMFSMAPGIEPHFRLPSNFPFSNIPIAERIHWFEEGSTTHARYKFNVYFEYYLDESRTKSFPADWILRSSAVSILGRVEVDYRILRDAEFPLGLTADLVLEMMEQSLLHEQPLRLSRNILPNSGDDKEALGNTELFELRTFSGVLLSEILKRTVEARNCGTCGEFLPPTGPHLCLSPLSDTTSR